MTGPSANPDSRASRRALDCAQVRACPPSRSSTHETAAPPTSPLNPLPPPPGLVPHSASLSLPSQFSYCAAGAARPIGSAHCRCCHTALRTPSTLHVKHRMADGDCALPSRGQSRGQHQHWPSISLIKSYSIPGSDSTNYRTVGLEPTAHRMQGTPRGTQRRCDSYTNTIYCTHNRNVREHPSPHSFDVTKTTVSYQYPYVLPVRWPTLLLTIPGYSTSTVL